MEMYRCSGCGYYEMDPLKCTECSACGSKHLKLEVVHDNSLLQQEQLLYSQIPPGSLPIFSMFDNADSIDFMGVDINRKDFPVLFNWALKNALSLESYIRDMLKKLYKDKEDQLKILMINMESDLTSWSENDLEDYLKSKGY